jgi:hypothetical protein
MRTIVREIRISRLALATVVLTLAGCGAGANVASEEPLADYNKVRMMTGFYEGYLRDHRGRPPANEQAFREYLNGKQDMLQQAGVTLDQMFVSPRGDKPLKWAYGRQPPIWRQNGMTCYAYEAEPVAGKRLVIGGRGMTVEMDDAQFKTVFPTTSK